MRASATTWMGENLRRIGPIVGHGHALSKVRRLVATAGVAAPSGSGVRGHTTTPYVLPGFLLILLGG